MGGGKTQNCNVFKHQIRNLLPSGFIVQIMPPPFCKSTPRSLAVQTDRPAAPRTATVLSRPSGSSQSWRRLASLTKSEEPFRSPLLLSSRACPLPVVSCPLTYLSYFTMRTIETNINRAKVETLKILSKLSRKIGSWDLVETDTE